MLPVSFAFLLCLSFLFLVDASWMGYLAGKELAILLFKCDVEVLVMSCIVISFPLLCNLGFLFGLRLSIPVNNFSVMFPGF